MGFSLFTRRNRSLVAGDHALVVHRPERQLVELIINGKAMTSGNLTLPGWAHPSLGEANVLISEEQG
jgi:hypothetical protein